MGAAFNGDESRILTWTDDNTARLWDAATGKEVVAPLRHEDAVTGAVFNRDESRILTWSDDNTAAAVGRGDRPGGRGRRCATRARCWAPRSTATRAAS